MNDLLLLIYLADISANLSVALTFGMIFTIACVIVYYVYAAHEIPDDQITSRQFIKGVVVFSIMAVVNILVPSRTTLYAIAGARVAEAAVTSELGKSVVELVKRRVEKELKGETK